MPLNKYGDGKPEDEICKGCRFYPTKTEAAPEAIADRIATALNLSELQRSGASFMYPDGLTAVEWCCLSGLTRGRDRADGLQKQRERQEQRKKNKKRNG